MESFDDNFGGDNQPQDGNINLFAVKIKFKEFLRVFNEDNAFYKYRDTLKRNYLNGRYFLQVEIEDLAGYDESLADKLTKQPSEHLQIFEKAAKEVVDEITAPRPEDEEHMHNIQILLVSNANPTNVRDLKSDSVSGSLTGTEVFTTEDQENLNRIKKQLKLCFDTDFRGFQDEDEMKNETRALKRLKDSMDAMEKLKKKLKNLQASKPKQIRNYKYNANNEKLFSFEGRLCVYSHPRYICIPFSSNTRNEAEKLRVQLLLFQINIDRVRERIIFFRRPNKELVRYKTARFNEMQVQVDLLTHAKLFMSFLNVESVDLDQCFEALQDLKKIQPTEITLLRQSVIFEHIRRLRHFGIHVPENTFDGFDAKKIRTEINIIYNNFKSYCNIKNKPFWIEYQKRVKLLNNLTKNMPFDQYATLCQSDWSCILAENLDQLDQLDVDDVDLSVSIKETDLKTAADTVEHNAMEQYNEQNEAQQTFETVVKQQPVPLAANLATNQVTRISERKSCPDAKRFKRKRRLNELNNDESGRKKNKNVEAIKCRSTAREDEFAYCYCRRPHVSGISQMIACDGDNCSIEWFHFECVSIVEAPQGKWFCPECRPQYSEELHPTTNATTSAAAAASFPANQL